MPEQTVPQMKRQPKAIDHALPPLRLAVYGEGGIGKTTLALTFPKPIVVNTDAGLEGDAIEGVTGDEWRPDNWYDLNALYYWLKAKIKEKGYQTVVIDSISELCVIILHEAMTFATKTRPANAEDTQLQGAEQQDYGKVAYAIDRFLTMLRQLSATTGVHIVITSGVRPKNVEKDKLKRGFDVQPAVEAALTYWANVYGELVIVAGEDKVEHRVLWTNPGDRERINKTRFSALHPGVVDPSFSRFRELIEARLRSQTAKTETKETSK